MMNFTALIDVDTLAELLQGSELLHGAGLPEDSSRSAADSRIVVLDCRFDLTAPAAGRQAYDAAHIPGARYVDLNQDLAAPIHAASGRHPLPSPDRLAARFASLGIGNDVQVIAYDGSNGSFAARAWWLLRWLGHSRVAVLDGGFNAWVAGGGALESAKPGLESSGYRQPEPQRDPQHDDGSGDGARRPVRFTPHPNSEAVATSAEVLKALQDPARLLVDARAAERFAGTVEPIDPVSGHVPGAVNHPFSMNLGPQGRFLPHPELRRRWQERLAGTAPKGAILMCGSGVTACHNLLAMEVAGLPGAKLYAGSWSEWIRDPERPVARGGTP